MVVLYEGTKVYVFSNVKFSINLVAITNTNMVLAPNKESEMVTKVCIVNGFKFN